MGPPTPRTVFDLSFISPVPYHYLFLAILVLAGLTWQMQRSRMGYYLAPSGTRPRRPQSRRADPAQQTLRLLLSAGFTAIAGSLYAVMVGFVDPDRARHPDLGEDGDHRGARRRRTLFGPLVGAVILVPLEETTNAWFGGSGTGITFIVYGAIILLITRFQPGGVAVIWRLRARRAKAPETAGAAGAPMSLKPGASPRRSALPRGGCRLGDVERARSSA